MIIMDNLNIGHIAAAVVIVEFFNLAIILLTKTETILKIVERIKKVVGLDYKSRAKRSDEEIKIAKRHSQVARERVRHSFISVKLWGCNWFWNWSDDLEPINIKGFCSTCNYPVDVYYYYPDNESPEAKFRSIGIACSSPENSEMHNQLRSQFEVAKPLTLTHSSGELFQPFITKAIISERDTLIANQIDELRKQFWR
jgi:hypothetical protein